MAWVEAAAACRPSATEVPSSRALAVRAARACLARAGAERVDLLVYVGVYRDQSVREPAQALLVLHDLALPGPVHGWDLEAGSGGVLIALSVVADLLQPGQRALVVAADVDPTPGRSQGFPYAPWGGAVLVGPQGALRIGRLDRAPTSGPATRATLDWQAGDRPGHTLRVETDAAALAELGQVAEALLGPRRDRAVLVGTLGLQIPGPTVPPADTLSAAVIPALVEQLDRGAPCWLLTADAGNALLLGLEAS